MAFLEASLKNDKELMEWFRWVAMAWVGGQLTGKWMMGLRVGRTHLISRHDYNRQGVGRVTV